MDPMKAIGVILIASFLIDSVINGLFTLLAFSARWRRWMPDPELLDDPVARANASRNRKLLYSLLAGTLGIFVIAGYLQVRILALTGMVAKDTYIYLDTLLTGLILMGGADRMTEALKLMGGGETSKSRPVEVTGRLVIDNGAITLTRSESDISPTKSC